MIKFTSLLFFILFVVSCGHPKGKPHASDNDTVIKEERNLTTGVMDQTLVYVNGKLNGPVTSYYPNGIKKSERFYKDSIWTGELKVYTLERELALEETWTFSADHPNNRTLKDRKIYWQEIPFDTREFLFVSDSGFYMVKDGIATAPDVIKPDNIIEEERIPDGTVELFIWKKGRKIFYKQLVKD